MSLLASLATDSSIANETDSVGSSVLDSNIYAATVQTAYIERSEGGALGLVFTAKTEDGKLIRQTLWMTSGTAKGGRNYYEKDGVKNYLPGFIAANSLALLTTGKEIAALDTESKVVKKYSKEARAEVPAKVDMVMEMLDKPIHIGLLRQTVDKTAKNELGAYVPTGETRDENEIDKFFRSRDMMTTTEIRAQAEAATFHEAWKAKWVGVTKQKSSGASANAGVAGAPKGARPAAKPATSLFA